MIPEYQKLVKSVNDELSRRQVFGDISDLWFRHSRLRGNDGSRE
jgi:hypothetical protein